MQRPTMKGLNATANLCTIAHITVLAVALTAVKIDQKDKIRFVKTLIPKIEPLQDYSEMLQIASSDFFRLILWEREGIKLKEVLERSKEKDEDLCRYWTRRGI
jgi:hypothetical protein